MKNFWSSSVRCAGSVGILGPLVARTLRASHETTALLEQLNQASTGRPR
jgi:hypothetical protein